MADFSDLLFSPKGIVVIGASSDPGKLGYAVARNLIQGGYPGAVHFVNPKGGTLFEHTLHRSPVDVPDPVELAVIIVPAFAALQAIKDTGRRGIHAAIVTSGGFRETGENGAALENQILAICREYGIRLIGPNCIGLVDTHLPLDTTFLPPPPPAPGNVAFISHSGAFCAAVIDWSRRQGFGFSRLASLGNQADLSETDFLPVVAGDPHTKAIALYLESIPDGMRFLNTAREITPSLPMVAMKVGRTSSGQQAAASHTGALAGSEIAADAAFEKAGIFRALTSDDLFDWSRALANFHLPAGRHVAILTNAGGPGVIAADALVDHNLALANLNDRTRDALQTRLPQAASTHNPVDMLASASPDDYASCLELLLADVQVHAVLVIIPPSPVLPTELIARALIPVMMASTKPVIPVLMGSTLVQPAFEEFNRNGIPCYPFPERAASALAKLADRSDFLDEIRKDSPPPPEFDELAVSTILSSLHRGTDDPSAGYRLLDSIGIRTAPVRLAPTREEAGRLALELGFPLAAKISSPDILHKSDVGGVLLNLHSAAEVQEAFDLLLTRAHDSKPDARLSGITLQRQIPPGQEVILGMARDPHFGPLVMFGSGGVDVEGLKDVAFCLAPLTPIEAARMIERTWAGKKMDGFRGLPPADKEAVADALVRLSWLAFRNPVIAECDINPLTVLEHGAIAVDVRIVVNDASS
jgi:acetyltransferase